MKKLGAFSLLIGILVSCGSENKSAILGTWRQSLPIEKVNQIKAALAQNEVEIQEMTTVPQSLEEQYATKDLNELKEIMLSELRMQYQPNDHMSYEFTKDGYLVATNSKNESSDTLFTYELSGDELSLSLKHESLAFSESIFEEGSLLNILRCNQDSLIMTMTAGTFVDTIYMLRENQSK